MEIKIAPVKEIEVTQVGSTFEFPFDYLRKGFVHTTVNDEDEDARSFTIVDKSIVFDTPLQVGNSLRIYRSTPTTPLVSWADASVLKAKDMTIQQVQELHILEEEDYRFQGIEDKVDNAVDDVIAYATTAENAASTAQNAAKVTEEIAGKFTNLDTVDAKCTQTMQMITNTDIDNKLAQATTIYNNTVSKANEVTIKANEAGTSAISAANSASSAITSSADAIQLLRNTTLINNSGNADLLSTTNAADIIKLSSDLYKFTGYKNYPFTSGGYIRLDQATTSYAVTSEASFSYVVIDVENVKKFYIDVVGGNRGRAYGFVDSNGNVLVKADANETVNGWVDVPINAVKLVCNTSRIPSEVKTGVTIIEVQNNINALAQDLSNITNKSISNVTTTILDMYPSSNKLNANTSTNQGKTLAFKISDNKKYQISIKGNFNRFIVFGANSINSGSALTTIYNSASTVAYEQRQYEYISDGTYSYICVSIAFNFEQYALMSCDCIEITGYDQNPLKIRGVEVASVDDIKSLVDNSYDGYTTDISVEDVGSASDLYALYDNLVDEFPNYITKTNLGEDGFGNNLYEYKFATDNHIGEAGQRPKDSIADKNTILLVSGVHGNERSSVMGTYQFCRDLCMCKHGLENIRGNYILKVIPLVNPSGFNNNTRFNSATRVGSTNIGVNINLNFTKYWQETPVTSYNDYGGASPADQKETQIVERWLASNSNAILFIDYHNSGYVNEVSYLAGENVSAIKNAFLKSMNKLQGYLENQCDFSSGLIFSYVGNFNHSAMSYYQAQNVGIANSVCLEASYNQNSSGLNSSTTIKTNAEILGNFLVEMYEE